MQMIQPLNGEEQKRVYDCGIYIQGGPKNGLFLTVENFATANRRKACDMSKDSENFV